MKITDVFDGRNPVEEMINEAQITWARSGNKVVRKYRCTTGRKKGRIVSSPATCSAPVDQKKRIQMKKTKAAKGPRMARKARRTKRINPASRRVQQMNKALKGR